MEIVIQKIERQEIHLVFVQDAEENIDDVSSLVTSLAKLKKIINKPGFKNEFDKGERESYGIVYLLKYYLKSLFKGFNMVVVIEFM